MSWCNPCRIIPSWRNFLLPLWGKLVPRPSPWPPKSHCSSPFPWPYCLAFPRMSYKWHLPLGKMYSRFVLTAWCVSSWLFLSLSTSPLCGCTTAHSSFLRLKSSVVSSFRWLWRKKKDYHKYLCTGFVSAFLIFYFYFCKYSALSGICI